MEQSWEWISEMKEWMKIFEIRDKVAINSINAE